MDTIKAIKTRRSIRIFDSKDVKEEPIMCIIDAARWAPSGGNRQPWEFIVITRPEARKAIASLYVEAPIRLSLCYRFYVGS
jgi:nitroreductase